MKRTSERSGWSGRPWTSRFRKNRDGASQGHPLDPLNYNSERQLLFSKKRSEYFFSLLQFVISTFSIQSATNISAKQVRFWWLQTKTIQFWAWLSWWWWKHKQHHLS